MEILQAGGMLFTDAREERNRLFESRQDSQKVRVWHLKGSNEDIFTEARWHRVILQIIAPKKLYQDFNKDWEPTTEAGFEI